MVLAVVLIVVLYLVLVIIFPFVPTGLHLLDFREVDLLVVFEVLVTFLDEILLIVFVHGGLVSIQLCVRQLVQIQLAIINTTGVNRNYFLGFDVAPTVTPVLVV